MSAARYQCIRVGDILCGAASKTAYKDLLYCHRMTTDEEERSEAFWTLEALCRDVAVRNAVFQEGAIPDMLHYLPSSGAVGAKSKLDILVFLKDNASFMSELEAVIHSGDGYEQHSRRHAVLVTQLLRCFVHDDRERDSFKNSEELLLILAKNSQQHDIGGGFIAAQAISILMNILQTGESRMAAKASEILRQLMQNPLCCEIASVDFLDTLITMVAERDTEGKVAASRVIAPIARSDKTKKRVIQSSLGTVCLALFPHQHGSHYDTDDIPYEDKLVGVQLLAILADDDSARGALLAQDIVHQLSHLTHRETGVLLDIAMELLKRCRGESWLRNRFSFKLPFKKVEI